MTEILTPAALLARARAARRDGRFAEAETLAREALRSAPHLANATLELATALRLDGRAEAAEAAIAAALGRDAAGAHMLLEGGRIARARGAQDAALERFARAATAAPDNLQAQLELSVEARQAGDMLLARRAALAATRVQPDMPRAWLLLGLAEAALGDRQAAVAAYEMAARDPDFLPARLELARLATEAGDGAAASRHLAEAPPTPPVLLARGRLALASGRTIEAAGDFAEALQADPTLLPARAAWVRALARLGLLAEAQKALDEAPDTPAAHHALLAARAALLRARGEWPQARDLLRDSIRAGDRRFAIWHGWWSLELLIGDTAEQAACLAAAPPAADAAERAALLCAAADAAEQSGDIAAARDAFAAAAAADPGDAAAQGGLARMALLAGDEAAAMAALAGHAEAEAVQRRLRGLSLNATQSLTGQIAVEFRLLGPALARLREIAALPPAARIEPLLAEIGKAPDSTAPALLLLLALRQAGLLAAGEGAIPPRMMAVEAAGIAARLPLAAWQAVQPELATHPFTQQDGQRFLAERYGAAAERIARRSLSPEAREMLLRLGWLAAEGGWSVTVGTWPRAPVSTLAGAGFLAGQGSWEAPRIELIGAAPGEPVVQRAFDLLLEALDRGDQEHPWLLAGPGLLARAIAQCLAESGPGWRATLSRIALLEARALHAAAAIGGLRLSEAA